MNYLKLNEKLLKHHLKNKKRITLSLIVAFMITGGLGFTEEEILARDLRPRQEKNKITPDNTGGKGPTIGSAGSNNVGVVNIVTPGSNGISHNQFIDFNVGQQGVIFNNNATGNFINTSLGGLVEHNKNLTSGAATAILNEVTGREGSYLDGAIEIAGQRADFILANENGISVNGAGFINASGVTLTTGKVNQNGGTLNVDVTKGNITIEGDGLETSGSYFNVISQTIDLYAQVSARKGEGDADLNFIAGNNSVSSINSTIPKVVGEIEGTTMPKYGIYAGPLGAMYGNNIRLISTVHGLGVRHEGIIRSKGDIIIDADGDIAIGALNSEGNIDVKGTGKLDTLNGTYKVGDKLYNHSITSKKGIKLAVSGDMEISSYISANGTENFEITAKNLKVLGNKKTTAGILAQGQLIINVAGDINIEALLRPVRNGGTSDDPPLVVETDANGNVKVLDPITGTMLNENEYSWVGTGIQGERIDISSTNFTNDASISNTRRLLDKSSIKINVKEKLINNKLISSSGTLELYADSLENKEGASLQGADIKIVAGTIDNNGDIRQNINTQGETANRLGKVEIDLKKGTFTNNGVVSGYEVVINGEGFILQNTEKGKIVASTVDYPLGQGSITINVKNLENKGLIQSYGAGIENNIIINVETLSNILGHIIAQRGDVSITSKGEIVNSGEIYAEKNVSITSTGTSIRNEGGSSSIGAGQNVTIKAESAKLENRGKIYATQKLLVIVSELLNAGDSEGLKKYLEAFYNLGQDGTKKIDEIIKDLETQLGNETSEIKKQEFQEKITLFKDLKNQLKDFNSALETLPGIGTMSANSIEITTGSATQNNGIVKANQDIKITSNGKINNTGILEAGTDVTLKADGDIVNSQRIYAGNKIDITGKSFEATGSSDLLQQYVTILNQFSNLGGDDKLNELSNEIKKLEEELKVATQENLTTIKKKLDDFIKERAELAKLKAQISALVEKRSDGKDGIGLSTIESKNVSITTTDGYLKNDGLIVTSEDLTLKAQRSGSDITNTGNISVGKNVDIIGNSFKNSTMTVGGKFTASIENKLESDSLTVAGDMEVTKAKNAEFSNLDVGGNANITLQGNEATNVTFGKDKNSKVNVTGNLGITGGGLVNKATTAIKGTLNVDKNGNNSAKFENTEILGINENAIIKINGFTNSGEIVAEKGLNVESTSFANSGEVMVKEKLDVKSSGSFDNSKNIVAKQGLNVESTSFTNKQDAKINTSNFTLKAGNAITNQGSIEAKGNLDIDGEKTLNNSGKILVEGSGKIDIKDSITNSGDIKVGKSTTATQVNGELKSGDLSVKTGIFTNNDKGNVTAENDLTIEVTSGFNNKSGGNISGGNVLVDGTATSLNQNFTNGGSITSAGKLTVDLGINKKDINLDSSGKLASKDTLTLTTGGNISNAGQFSNEGGLTFNAGGAITNTGTLASLNDINLTATGNVTNGTDGGNGSTIWSAEKINITSKEGNINNYRKSSIISNGDMSLTAEKGTLLNKGGKISSGGQLDINVKNLKNETIANLDNFKIEMVPLDSTDQASLFNADFFNHVYYNGYDRADLYIWLPRIEFADKVDAVIEGQEDVNIKVKEKAHNISAKISSGQNLNITGVASTPVKIVNETLVKNIDIVTYLKHTRVVYEEIVGNVEKVLYNGNMYDAYVTPTNGHTQYLFGYNPVLDIFKKVHNGGGGKDWGSETMKEFYALLQEAGAKLDSGGIFSPENFKKDVNKTYYSGTLSAKILARKDIKLINVELDNKTGSQKIENTEVSVDLGNGQTVDTVETDLKVTVTDPNSVTEVNGIKYPSGVQVITGSVTINGVTIDASTGGLVSAIAVAGTINPISYIEIPEGNNGLFRPGDPRPGEKIQYKFETNLDFIDPSKYFGSEYFFDKIGYDPDRTSTVIGDAYYETQLINKVIKDALGYTGEVTADYIKTMLDSAADTQDDLGLVVGKPLTPDQINNLEKDIIWYVEVDMDGEKVLVPQVYFGKETRIEMAQGDKGGGFGSTIKAGGNIDIQGGSVNNTNANIVAGGNINMDVTGDVTNSATGGFQGGIAAGGDIGIKAGGDLDMIGGTITSTDGGVSIETGGDINIESTLGGNLKNQNISNKAGITAKGDVTVKSEGDTTIKNGTINSSEGDVALSGKNVNIEDQNLISSGESFDFDRISKTESKYAASTSVGSEIGGKNVTINAENDVNITGSTVAAEKDTTIKAGNDVNIKDGTDHYYEETKTTTNGFDLNYKLNIGSSNSKLEATTSVGSVVGGGEGLTINSGNDVNIKGSTVVGGEKGVNITAEKNVNITDGQNTVKGESHSQSYDVISYQKKDSKFETTTSVGSGIVSGGNINITAKEGNVTSVGTEMAATGDTNITAKGDVKFEAGKNTHTEESSSIGIGIMSGTASAGIAGYNAQASWTPTGGGTASVEDGNASDQTIDEMNKFGKGGKNYMDSLTNVGTEIGISIKNESKKSTTWTEGNIKSGGNINITSGETADIGGVNLGAGKDINIAAKDVETTKYVDEHEEKSSNIGISIKVDNMTTSAIADAVNKGMQIHESATGQDGGVNGALTAAQVAGTATNVVFGDLISNTTAVTGNISYGTSHTKTTEENTTTIDAGGNVNIKATEGDINLKGVDVKAEDGVSLDAAENVNIEAAKKTEYEKTTGINASAGFTTSAGVTAIDGGNVQIGATATGSYSETNKNNTTYTGSSIDAGGKITISSGKDTNVVGSTVTGNEVDLDVGGDLNIITKTDDIDQSRKEGWGGADISGGLATNTIGTGDIGISGGGGNIWQSGDKITGQAGITAKKEINVDVKGDANLVGGVLGSETGEGNMKVGGDLNVTDVKSNYEEGGAIIGVNAGTEGGGILGEVGDRVDLEQTAKGTINIGNVEVGGDVTLNGDKSDLDSINKDLENTITTEKDEKENGGTFSGTASALPTKKKSSGSYDFPDGGPTPTKDPDPIKVKVGEVPKPKVEHAEITELPKPQRAEISEVPKPEKAKVSKPEIQDPKYPDPIKGKIEKTPVPKVEKAKSEDLPKPDYAEPIPQPPIKGVVVKDGWIKTEHGWIQSQKGPQGAVTTQGPFNKKGLDGFRDGIESLGKGKIENGPGVNQAVKKSQNTDNGDVFVDGVVKNGSGVNQAVKKSQGPDPDPTKGEVVKDGWIKTDTGWVQGQKGQQGAITTQGPFNKKGLDGFRDGVESLGKGKIENGPGVNQATKKTQGGDDGDVFVDGVVKNGPGTNQAVKKSQGPDPDPTKGEVVKDGWIKTDTGWVQGQKGQQGAITTQGPFNKKGLDGFRDGIESLGKGKIENGPGVNQATKKSQNTDDGDVFVDGVVKNGPGTNQAVKKTQEPDSDPTKGEVVKDGWIKTDAGWQQTTKGQQGAITTQGPFTKKGLDGFRDGVESLGKGKIENGPGVNQATKKTQGGDEGDVFVDPKVENGPGVNQAVKKTQGGDEGDAFIDPKVENGSGVNQAVKKTQEPDSDPTKGEVVKDGWIKTDTGWQQTTKGQQGAITTQGPFTKKGLDGFRDGVDSLGKGKIENGLGVNQATKKTQGGDEGDVFVDPKVENGPGTNQAVKKTQGGDEGDAFIDPKVENGPGVNQAVKKTQEPDSDPTKGEVVKDGWIKTDTGWQQTTKGQQGAITTQGPFTKKGLDGFRDGVDSLGKGKIENGPGVNQATKKTQGGDEGDVFVDPKVENGLGVNQAVKKTQGGDEGDVFVDPKVENGPGVNQAVKKSQNDSTVNEGPVTNNGYVKGEDGKWYPTRTPGQQGAALTGGLSYQGVKGFQKGVKDLAAKNGVIKEPNTKFVVGEDGTYHNVKFTPNADGGVYVKDENGNYHKVEEVDVTGDNGYLAPPAPAPVTTTVKTPAPIPDVPRPDVKVPIPGTGNTPAAAPVTTTVKTPAPIPDVPRPDVKVPIPGTGNTPAAAPKTTTVETPAPIPDVPRPDVKVPIPGTGNTPAAAPKTTTVKTPAPIPDVPRPDVKVPIPGTGNTPAAAPKTTTVETPAPIPDVPRPDVKVPIPGTGNTPAAAPKTTTVETPAPIPDVPRPDVKVPIPGTGNTPAAAPKTTTVETPAPIPDVPRPDVKVPIPGTGNTPAAAPKTTTVETPAPIPDVPRPDVKVPIPGTGNTPAAAPKTTTVETPAPIPDVPRPDVKVPIPGTGNTPAAAPKTTTVETPAPIPDVPRPDVKVPIPGTGNTPAAAPVTTTVETPAPIPDVPRPDVKVPIPGTGNTPAAAPKTTTVETPAPIPDVPRPDVKVPIPGTGNTPAAAPVTTTVETPAPIPDVPRPDVKVPIPGTENSKKKVSFADDVEVTLVPEKDPSRTSVDEATGDVDAIAGSMDKLLTEQQALTDKLNSGKKLSKKEQERLDVIEKELNNLNDQLKDAIGRENVDREDSERIPEEMNDLLREKEALTDKVKNGEELTADEKDRFDEINLDLDTLQNTMANSKTSNSGYLAPPAPAPVTTTVKMPAPIPDVPRPDVKVPIPGAGGENRPPLPPVDYNQGDARPPLPPADYNQGDARPPLPPTDYNQGDARPPLPPADYNQGGAASKASGNSQKKVSFDDQNVDVAYVPKDDPTRKPDDIGEIDDALTRPDSERIPEEMNNLLAEKQKLTDKVNSGRRLTKKEQERLDEINLDLQTLQNTMANSKTSNSGYLAPPAPAPVTTTVKTPDPIPDVPRPEGGRVVIPGGENSDGIVYADLNLDTGSGGVHREDGVVYASIETGPTKKGSQNSEDNIYEDIDSVDGSATIDETKKVEKGSGSGSGGGGAVPGTSQNGEDASGTDTAKKIDELMKKQKELTSKKKLDDADRKELARIKKELKELQK